ncbi:unnamed protein product [Bursaphelenchus xylophilus]|uniref:(pine wood nematode) hypothetical protein n=1 Tax=Bursaphelenchus xylophilus TaxID=6326 RepID=A0A1I7RWA1_BURXY|nr:unnamed protein product [Bursaphelenchus xylophilus]CAG9095347.1 unnamed protein product [Bursaphelenchus xylophilus]
MEEPILEESTEIVDRKIGYQRYGHGNEYILGICGAVDPPGYGTSRPPDRVQEVNRCKKDAKYCIELMKKLNLVPFCAMGWSEGARTSIHVAHQGQTLVNRLVLMAASTRADARGDQGFQGIRNTDLWLPDMREKYLKFCTDEFLKVQWAALCDVIHEVFLNYGGRFPSDMILHKIKQPVLLTYGGADKFIMDQKYFKEKIPHLKEAVHMTGGHEFYVAYPRWLALRVNEFFRQTGGQH